MNRKPSKNWLATAPLGSGPDLRPAAALLLAVQLALFPMAGSAADAGKPSAAASSDSVLSAMQTELLRAKTDLAKADPAPYFMSYTVYDQDQVIIAASYGGLLSDTAVRRRRVDVTMRVGSPQLDNTVKAARAA
jgi:hypothetical protein